MKNSIKRNLFLVGITKIVLGSIFFTVPAMAIDFNFSFNNELNNGGAITGVIRGLDEGIRSATSVEVFSNTSGFGIGEYIGSPSNNTWTILGGEIVAFDFTSFGALNTSPAVEDSSIFFGSSELSGASFRAGIANSSFSITNGNGSVSTEDINLTFTPQSSTSVPFEFSPGLGIILTIGGFGLRQLKRKLSLNSAI